MQYEFEISMMGELIFFLGLQIKQTEEWTIFYQEKYANKLVKKFHMENAKKLETPMSYSSKFDKDENGKKIYHKLYRRMFPILSHRFKTDILLMRVV